MAAMVSVVIPVFRVERYIEKCIQSLVGQTLGELEFIFIDDCGEDGSMEIVEKYASSDPRFVILRNETNSGAGFSRNHGIDHAKGEYIGFVDPDDWINESYFETLYRRAKAGDYDIVKGRRVQAAELEDGSFRYKCSKTNDRIKAGLSKGEPLFAHFTSEHQTAIYRNALIQQYSVRNGSSSHSENSVFLLGACYYAQKFCIESEATYYYYQRPDSSVHILNQKKYEGEIVSLHEQVDFICGEIETRQGIETWALKKIRYLIRRYDELSQNGSINSFSHQFIQEVTSEFGRLSLGESISNCGYRVDSVVKGETGRFVAASRAIRFIDHFPGAKRFLLQKRRQLKKNSQDSRRVRFEKIVRDGGDLVYIQNHKGCIIFSQDFARDYSSFAEDYVSSLLQGNASLGRGEFKESSLLYQEHKSLAEEGELCWRYIKRFGRISKTTVYKDQSGNLRMRGEVLGSNPVIETPLFIVHPQVERDIVPGKTLRDYVWNLGIDDTVSELISYIDYLFDRFATDDDGFVSGLAYDAFPFNCLIVENHAYRIFDLEFEFKDALDKGYIVYKVASTLKQRKRKPVYYRLCERYGLVPKWDYWDDFNFRNWIETIAIPDDASEEEDERLFRKYFL